MMKAYLHKTPGLFSRLYPGRIWHKSRAERTLYLSFDDGPIPELTPWVLNTLKEFEAKATFFMVGQNVERYPQLAQRVKEEGHSIGNHTHRHLKASQHRLEDYLTDIKEAGNTFQRVLGSPVQLFRPPYGRLPSQYAKQLKEYSIVMWDVLSGDFDPDLSATRCLEASIKASQPGSILVFHDNVKSTATLKAVLPSFLQYYKDRGFSFSAL
jgi:peptidoglycan/xylan/chitin deacetylase (PgdA/CDA1 family)